MLTYIQRILKESFRALFKKKIRSLLTMLGVIIGVAAVITMQAVGAGVKQDVSSEISTLGYNMIVIIPSASEEQGVRSDAGSQKIFKRRFLTHVKENCQSIQYVSSVSLLPAQIKYKNENWKTSVMGVEPDYFNIRSIRIKKGSFFSMEDVRLANNYCLIGKTVQTNIFQNEDPLNKIIRINHIPFKVIGILDEKGQSSFGQDQDDIILAPVTTVLNKMMETEYISQIFASASSEDKIESGVEELKTFLNEKLAEERKSSSSFTVRTSSELKKAAGQITSSLTLLLATIAGISLLVGGIGIMNIMLVSVTERTREIGLRLAIGATGFDVRLQLLLEAIAMSLTGGLMGVLLGLLATYLIQTLIGWTAIISVSSIVVSFSVSVSIGVFFGWYPANKAASLNPIDALRYE